MLSGVWLLTLDRETLNLLTNIRKRLKRDIFRLIVVSFRDSNQSFETLTLGHTFSYHSNIVSLSHRDHNIHIEIANMQCKGIAYIILHYFYTSWRPMLATFNWTANNHLNYYENLVNPLKCWCFISHRHPLGVYKNLYGLLQSFTSSLYRKWYKLEKPLCKFN